MKINTLFLCEVVEFKRGRGKDKKKRKRKTAKYLLGLGGLAALYTTPLVAGISAGVRARKKVLKDIPVDNSSQVYTETFDRSIMSGLDPEDARVVANSAKNSYAELYKESLVNQRKAANNAYILQSTRTMRKFAPIYGLTLAGTVGYGIYRANKRKKERALKKQNVQK